MLALYAGVPFIAFLHLSDMAPIYQVSFFSRLILRVGLTAVLLIAIRAGFFRVKAGWACAAVLALLALGVYLDVRSGASRLTSYFSPEAMQLWRSLAQKQPFADQLMNRTLRQLQQAGLSSAVPAWVWMGLLFGPMAAFLALLLARAAKADLSAGEAAVPAGRAPARHPVRAGRSVPAQSVPASRAAAVHHRKPLFRH